MIKDMSEIRVAAWNMLNALGDPSRVLPAYKLLMQSDAAVIQLGETAEAKDLDGEIYAASLALLSGAGFRLATANVSDQLGVRSNHGIAMLVREDVELRSLKTVQTGERNGMLTRIGKDAVEWAFGGVLLPDYSADQRVRGVFDMHEALGGSEVAVMMGDFNDMHPKSVRAMLARTAGRIEAALPGEVSDYYESKGLERKRGLVQRLGSMAEGRAIMTAMALGYRCVDPADHTTIGSGPFAFGLDHIFVSPGVESSEFTRYDRRGQNGHNLSDHHMVAATLHYTA